MTKKNNEWPIAKFSGKTVKAVVVTWLDAVGNENHALPPFPIISIGYLVEDNEDHIILAAELHADGDTRGYSTIPKSLIRSAQVLSVKVPQFVLDYKKAHG